MLNTFIRGVSYPWRAIQLIRRNRSLWGNVLWPVVLNLILGITIYTSLLLAGLSAINSWISNLPTWASGIGWLLQIFLIVVLLISTGFVLVRFGVILGAPFYGRMSEMIEELLRGELPINEPLSLSSVLRDIFRALGFELKKLGLTLSISLPALLLNFIPVAGQALATAVTIGLGVLIACLDYFDPPLERRRLRFREKIRYIRQHMPASLGFGLMALGLVSLPLINLLSIPLCIAAGTLFFAEQQETATTSTPAA